MKEDNKHSRRKFISKFMYMGSFLGGAFLLGNSSLKAAANNKLKPISLDDPGSFHDNEPKATLQDTTKVVKKDPCDDFTGVSPAELAKRKKLAYVNKSPIAESHCSVCALYLPPAKGKACGGCALFKGPVNAGGYCAYFAPIN